jgi:integrase
MGRATLKGLRWVTIRRAGYPVRHYCYAWRGGPLIQQATGGPRPALTAEALALYQQAVGSRDHARADTVEGLAQQWRASPEWRKLADSTRKQWGYRLDAIVAKWGEVPLHILAMPAARPKVIAWRNSMADNPRKADYAIQVLRALFAFGIDLGVVERNPAQGIGALYEGGNRAAIIWEPHEREVWEGAVEPVRIAYKFACLTGLRRADLCAVTWEAVTDLGISWQPAKGRGKRTALVPMYPALKALLDATRPENARGPILRNASGRGWTPDALSHAFTAERDRLGLPDKHLHDCRGTFATELMLAGLSDDKIAGVLGWGSVRVAEVRRIYVDRAATVVQISRALSVGKKTGKKRV